MTKIKYDVNIMKYMSLFETLTQTKLKDCIINDKVIFIVEENQIGKAIGKKGINVKKIENILKKKIKIAEFNSNVLQFIQNFIYPLKVKDIKEENKIVTIIGPDTKTKGLLIGRDAKNLNNLKSIVKRYFDIDDIKVI